MSEINLTKHDHVLIGLFSSLQAAAMVGAYSVIAYIENAVEIVTEKEFHITCCDIKFLLG